MTDWLMKLQQWSACPYLKMNCHSFYYIIKGVFTGSLANLALLSIDLRTFHAPLENVFQEEKLLSIEDSCQCCPASASWCFFSTRIPSCSCLQRFHNSFRLRPRLSLWPYAVQPYTRFWPSVVGNQEKLCYIKHLEIYLIQNVWKKKSEKPHGPRTDPGGAPQITHTTSHAHSSTLIRESFQSHLYTCQLEQHYEQKVSKLDKRHSLLFKAVWTGLTHRELLVILIKNNLANSWERSLNVTKWLSNQNKPDFVLTSSWLLHFSF